MQDKKLAMVYAIIFSAAFPVIAGAQPGPLAPTAVPAAAPMVAAPPAATEKAVVRAAVAKVEKAATENAQGNIDALRTEKLVASGLTGGVALAVQVMGPFNNSSAKQVNPKGVVMPYIMALPGYWGARQTTREACASAHSGASEETIDSAARAIARKRAARIVADIESAITAAGKPDAKATQIATDLSLDYGDGKDDRITNDRIVKEIIAYVDTDEADAQRKVLVDSMAGLEWKASRGAVCWPRRIGIGVGLPVNFDVATTVPNGDAVDAKETASRSVKPIVAAGFAFSPNAYFSVLLGVTACTVTREASTEKEAFERTIWATNVALEGNLDIITALAKRD